MQPDLMLSCSEGATLTFLPLFPRLPVPIHSGPFPGLLWAGWLTSVVWLPCFSGRYWRDGGKEERGWVLAPLAPCLGPWPLPCSPQSSIPALSRLRQHSLFSPCPFMPRSGNAHLLFGILSISSPCGFPPPARSSVNSPFNTPWAQACLLQGPPLA